MDDSPFNALPAELRNRIYHFALCDTEPVTIDFVHHGRRTRIGGRKRLLALTETCRQIHNESLSVFYADNDFLALIGSLAGTASFEDISPGRYAGGSPRFRHWLLSIGFDNAASIKRIEIQTNLDGKSTKLLSPLTAARLLRPWADFFARTGKRT